MKVTGLVGHPVAHSIGQTVYNRYYTEAGMDAIYIAADVTAENLGRFAGYASGEYTGYNVTIPHKVSVMEFLDSVDRDAAAIGAVNLVSIHGGKSRGHNTDYSAMKMISAGNGIPFDGSRIAIRGSGGVARTVIHYMKSSHRDFSITVLSDHPEQAEARLADYTGGPVGIMPFHEAEHEIFDILVNCSPAGMWPNTGEIPFPEAMIKGCRAGLDLVYNPPETLFMKLLSRNGKTAVGGTDFFVEQGLETLRILFGDADVEMFRGIVEKSLEEIASG